MSLDGEAKHPIDELVLCADVASLHPANLSLPDLVHRLVTLNRPPRTTELTKMLLGAHPSLDGTVILLEDVVQILNRSMTTPPSQDPFFLGFSVLQNTRMRSSP